ncbi:LrgB family protein [Clostridium sp. Marseille-Q7071]
MKELLSTPLFAILISLLSYILAQHISKKTKIALFNPLLLSMVFIISFLVIFKIPLEDYNSGGKLISFFLTPSTIVLALPLYNKIDLFKKNALPIIVGITVGSFVGMISIIILCKLLNIDNTIALSLIPKSITTPIGMEISKQLQGIPAITVTAIIITGIIGAIISPLVFKIFKIKDSLSIGIGIGTSSHAVGTTKAIEIGETEGAMSGLAIGIAGLITVCLSPIILKIFNILM